MLYGRDRISVKDVKASLLSKEKIDKEFTAKVSDNQAEGLVVRGRTKERNSGDGKSTSRSKSRHRDLTCNYCK